MYIRPRSNTSVVWTPLFQMKQLTAQKDLLVKESGQYQHKASDKDKTAQVIPFFFCIYLLPSNKVHLTVTMEANYMQNVNST